MNNFLGIVDANIYYCLVYFTKPALLGTFLNTPIQFKISGNGERAYLLDNNIKIFKYNTNG